jgi:hypothetical protein
MTAEGGFDDELIGERSCQSCGGDGFNWCEDQDSSEGCWERNCNGETHTCFNCHGTGAAKDQWLW